jgi:Tfp pilus assembly protein PilP
VIAGLDDDAIGSPAVAYEPAGRRDPFVDPRPKRTAPATPPTILRPPGFAGVATAEITLTGTVESGNGYIAIVEGPDRRTYIVRPGDRLFDGTIRLITEQAMLIETRAGNAAGAESGRDVWKVLRQTHEAR